MKTPNQKFPSMSSAQLSLVTPVSTALSVFMPLRQLRVCLKKIFLLISFEIFPLKNRCHLLRCVFILKIIHTLQKVRKVEKIIPSFILQIFISSMFFPTF